MRLLLRRAAGLSMTDPRGAFLLLKPGGNAISSLGPNFFTKFLYFAGGGALGTCEAEERRGHSGQYTSDHPLEPARSGVCS